MLINLMHKISLIIIIILQDKRDAVYVMVKKKDDSFCNRIEVQNDYDGIRQNITYNSWVNRI